MPITKKEIQEIVSKYDFRQISLGSLASHSTLDISRGAKDEGFRTIAICKKGREKTYTIYYKTRKRENRTIGCVDESIVLDDWQEMVTEKVLTKLQNLNTILIPHRSLQVYLKYNVINNLLKLPIFGNRLLLQAEERTGEYKIEKNQDKLIEIAKIPTPKKFNSPKEIDRPVIVKTIAAVGERDFERRFPVVKSTREYEKACLKLKEKGETEEEKRIIEKNFRLAPIEEYMEGHKINLNFFYSSLYEELELLGTDARWQFPNGEELAHIPISLRESLLEKAYDMGRKFVEICKKEYPPGIIGPFALQTVADKNENLLVYDVSLRIPGSPDTEVTPYTMYLYGERVSFGRRIAKEIKNAIRLNRLMGILT